MTRNEAIKIIKGDALYNPEVAEFVINHLRAWDHIENEYTHLEAIDTDEYSKGFVGAFKYVLMVLNLYQNYEGCT